MDRRDFLKLLGFGGAAFTSLQFLPNLPLTLATTIESVDSGPITYEWICAQMMAEVSRQIDGMTLEYMGEELRIGQNGLNRQMSIQLPFFDEKPFAWSRARFLRNIIAPKAEEMAEYLEFVKPQYSGRLPDIRSIEQKYFIYDELTHLSARLLVVPNVFHAPPGGPLLNRFDILVG